MTPVDRHARPLRSLRISVTDRCNLRCHYCMPERDYVWLPRDDLLHFEELDAVVGAFTALGVDRVRLTGGEPLIRKDLHELVGLLARRTGIRDLSLTTNGVLLPEHGAALRRAGLHRVTVSLDSLDRKRFARLAGRDMLPDVLAGIEHAASLGFTSLKLNTVVIAGENDQEIPELLGFAKSVGAELRFIEYMDVGGATRWWPQRVFGQREILAAIERAIGPPQPLPGRGSAPSERWRLPDGTCFGVIASTTQPFCGACDRSRLTADGRWFLCLYAREGIDLRERVRAGATHDELVALLAEVWAERTDRGAEDRLRLTTRGRLAEPRELRADPHLEMHTRGG